MKFILMMKSHNFFRKMVDELIDFSEYDPELADGIKWLDSEAQKKVLHSMIWCFRYYTHMILISKPNNG